MFIQRILRLVFLGALIVLLGCGEQPTKPEFARLASSSCGDCSPPPAAGRADFHLGDPQFVAGTDTFEVAVLVNTSQDVRFSQFTLDYDSNCLDFLEARRGSDLPAGTLFVNDTTGTAGFPVRDPNADRHVLVNVSGEYGAGCSQEVLVLKFRVTGAPPVLCTLRWDRSTPAGNPPNHLITSEPALIDPLHITFCDGYIFFGDRGSDCDCTVPPPPGAADLAVGAPRSIGSHRVEFPILVNTSQAVAFSQFTLDYRSDCLVFIDVAPGADLGGSPTIFTNSGAATAGFPVNDPKADRHVLANFAFAYGPGCDLEVLLLRFRIVATPPATCFLRWDDSTPPGNPPSHLLTGDPALIPPPAIQFCDGQLDLMAPGTDLTLIAIEDVDQMDGVDELRRIPDLATGITERIGSLGDAFKRTEAMATRFRSGGPTTIFAVDSDRLLTIDPMTGQGTLVGPIGFPDVDGIAFHPITGVLYGVTYGTNQLITIDPVTGQGTLARSNVASGYRLEDITFHPNGDAYILAGNEPRIIRVDLATGSEDPILLSGASSLEALTWSPDGSVLYSAADRGRFKDLVTIDLTARTITFVGSASSGARDLEALAWIETSRLP